MIRKELDLPWKRGKSIYSDNGPAKTVVFEVEGVQFQVSPTNKFGCDTHRRRYRVTCLTCDTIVHEATTGSTSRIEMHLTACHGWEQYEEDNMTIN